MNNKVLNIFTLDFPYGTEEPFLKAELDILAINFEKIFLYPMHFKSMVKKFNLPENVEIKHVDIFAPYNRLSVLRNNLRLVFSVFFIELIKSKNRFSYLFEFRKNLNVLLHRINASKTLSQSLGDKPSICYTYWFNQWTMVLSVLNDKQKNISVFTRIHGSDVYEEQHDEKNFFFPFRYFQEKQIKKVFAISNNGKEHLLKKSPQFKGKVVVNHLGVLPKVLNAINSSKEFVLVSCSSFQKYKRVHLIFEILKHVNFKITWIHFGDSSEREEVVKTFSSCPENVTIILKGYVSNSDLMNYYSNNSVDLFINVSETEGIPVSIMEAMSFGIPCLATNVGGVSEIVNENCGYLIAKNFDTRSVAEIINKHFKLSNENKLNLKNNSLQAWSSNFNVITNSNLLAKTLIIEK